MSSDFKPGSFVFSICTLIISSFLFKESLKINTIGIEWGGPRLFPSLISLIILVISTTITVNEGIKFYKYINRPNSGFIARFNLKEIISVIGLLLFTLIYALVVKKIGFLITTSLITLYTSLIFKAKIIDAIMVSLILSFSLMLLFKLVLGVPLPEGVLGW